MDFDFFVSIAEIGKLMYVKEHFANFRIHADSKTSTNLDMWSVEHEEIVKRYLPLNLNKIYLIYKKKLCRAQRILYYLLQDVTYVLKKCANKFRSITFWEELKL